MLMLVTGIAVSLETVPVGAAARRDPLLQLFDAEALRLLFPSVRGLPLLFFAGFHDATSESETRPAMNQKSSPERADQTPGGGAFVASASFWPSSCVSRKCSSSPRWK